MDEPWIQTYTGKRFTPFSPNAADINPVDIAHSLSMICRFNGHTRYFYSVAEHSVVMSGQVSKQAAIYALMHDASEAYLCDLAAPIKCRFLEFYRLECVIFAAILESAHIKFPCQSIIDEVNEADLRMLATERAQIMSKPPEPWLIDRLGIEPYDVNIRCMFPELAEHEFLVRLDELSNGYENDHSR